MGRPLWLLHLLMISSASTLAAETPNAGKPNIVIIMADDMGFDDISFRGSDHFLTPNIDALAFSGVILKNFYTAAMCTPSRSALLTGKYPIHTGMQHYVIANDQPWGLPVNETTMAEIFKRNGYHTSMFGKWHLGFSRKAYTPTKRGFDKHFGYLGAYVDYYDHTLFPGRDNFSRGHDMRHNLDVTHEHNGTYVTDLLTNMAIQHIREHDTQKQPLFMIMSHLAPHSANDEEPLQAPEAEIDKFSYIKDTNRRIYAAMMSLLDKSVGQLIDALVEKKILNNTIILFFSDNGGPTAGMHATTASNYPLKGQKGSPWEGALRSSGAIWSPLLEKLGTVWKQQMYIADVLPTLAAAAGIQLDPNLNLDGLNMWSALKYGYESVEREIVHNIDEIFEYVSYGKGKWKFVNGTTNGGEYDDWLGWRPTSEAENDPRSRHYEQVIRNTTVWQQLNVFNAAANEVDITGLRQEAEVTCLYANASEGMACWPLEEPCLFDTDADPCEQNNLYEKHRSSVILQEITKRIEFHKARAHKPNNKPSDPQCNPEFHDFEWTWWEDEYERNESTNSKASLINLAILLLITKVLRL